LGAEKIALAPGWNSSHLSSWTLSSKAFSKASSGRVVMPMSSSKVNDVSSSLAPGWDSDHHSAPSSLSGRSGDMPDGLSGYCMDGNTKVSPCGHHHGARHHVQNPALWAFVLPFFFIGLFVSVKYVVSSFRHRHYHNLSHGRSRGALASRTSEECIPLRSKEPI